MTRARIPLLLCVATVIATTPLHASLFGRKPKPDCIEPVVKTDKFTKTTIGHVTSEPLGRPKLSARLEISFYAAPGDTEALFGFQSQSPEWHYLHFQQLDLLLDGQPLEIGHTYDPQVFTGYVTEVFEVQFDAARLIQLLAAKKVEFRVGSDEFEMPPELICGLRKLIGTKPATTLAPPVTLPKPPLR